MLQIRNAKSGATPVDVTQSIYVTIAERQTIAQDLVYYLVELKSNVSQNSLYFIPTSVVASNGRYTKLTLTVIDNNETADPENGRFKFYGATGGVNEFPMGFYSYNIYEQTSSTNINPNLAGKLLQEGTAYVYSYDGNMEEVEPEFKEWDNAPQQFVYQ